MNAGDEYRSAFVEKSAVPAVLSGWAGYADEVEIYQPPLQPQSFVEESRSERAQSKAIDLTESDEDEEEGSIGDSGDDEDFMEDRNVTRSRHWHPENQGQDEHALGGYVNATDRVDERLQVQSDQDSQPEQDDDYSAKPSSRYPYDDLNDEEEDEYSDDDPHDAHRNYGQQQEYESRQRAQYYEEEDDIEQGNYYDDEEQDDEESEAEDERQPVAKAPIVIDLLSSDDEDNEDAQGAPPTHVHPRLSNVSQHEQSEDQSEESDESEEDEHADAGEDEDEHKNEARPKHRTTSWKTPALPPPVVDDEDAAYEEFDEDHDEENGEELEEDASEIDERHRYGDKHLPFEDQQPSHNVGITNRADMEDRESELRELGGKDRRSSGVVGVGENGSTSARSSAQSGESRPQQLPERLTLVQRNFSLDGTIDEPGEVAYPELPIDALSPPPTLPSQEDIADSVPLQEPKQKDAQLPTPEATQSFTQPISADASFSDARTQPQAATIKDEPEDKDDTNIPELPVAEQKDPDVEMVDNEPASSAAREAAGNGLQVAESGNDQEDTPMILHEEMVTIKTSDEKATAIIMGKDQVLHGKTYVKTTETLTHETVSSTILSEEELKQTSSRKESADTHPQAQLEGPAEPVEEHKEDHDDHFATTLKDELTIDHPIVEGVVTRARAKRQATPVEYAVRDSAPKVESPRRSHRRVKSNASTIKSSEEVRQTTPARLESSMRPISAEKDHSSPMAVIDSQPSPEANGHDASIELALSSLSSPSKAKSKPPPAADLKLLLSRALRTELKGLYTALKVLRYHISKKLDVLAIVTTAPSTPQRAKAGPRHYQITFNITDPSIAPAGVTEVQIFRPYKEALPVVQAGDGILLRNFQVISVKNRGFALKSLQDEGSSWAVFPADVGGEEVQMNGPPVELGEAETTHIASMKTWFQSLDATAKAKIHRANGDKQQV